MLEFLKQLIFGDKTNLGDYLKNNREARESTLKLLTENLQLCDRLIITYEKALNDSIKENIFMSEIMMYDKKLKEQQEIKTNIQNQIIKLKSYDN